MKNIQVNSENISCQAENLADLLTELNYGDAIVATALNGDFVAQGLRASTPLKDGDRIEILAPMQGG
ncbi:sulfur carrier protein ThiS [Marinomonas sp. C2222]|uniref:Sulfur carrier protein ThiS n=1 Tax=Marinomonas sargassi TaxID=2984494 RepID=A0ABT2YRG5_9GAMM|nr:sulfur carrier protein ThiS [Marinomonas sargassi]MCV2402487.1 sulfur carrier protein ThiS [Marinomonas sargassi]